MRGTLDIKAKACSRREGSVELIVLMMADISRLYPDGIGEMVYELESQPTRLPAESHGLGLVLTTA